MNPLFGLHRWDICKHSHCKINFTFFMQIYKTSLDRQITNVYRIYLEQDPSIKIFESIGRLTYFTFPFSLGTVHIDIEYTQLIF